jgi:hypothetical protein
MQTMTKSLTDRQSAALQTKIQQSEIGTVSYVTNTTLCLSRMTWHFQLHSQVSIGIFDWKLLKACVFTSRLVLIVNNKN